MHHPTNTKERNRIERNKKERLRCIFSNRNYCSHNKFVEYADRNLRKPWGRNEAFLPNEYDQKNKCGSYKNKDMYILYEDGEYRKYLKRLYSRAVRHSMKNTYSCYNFGGYKKIVKSKDTW